MTSRSRSQRHKTHYDDSVTLGILYAKCTQRLKNIQNALDTEPTIEHISGYSSIRHSFQELVKPACMLSHSVNIAIVC